MLGLGAQSLGLLRHYLNGSARKCVDEIASMSPFQFCCERTGTACHWWVFSFHNRTSVKTWPDSPRLRCSRARRSKHPAARNAASFGL